MSDSPTPSVSTMGSTTRKKRTIVVVRRPHDKHSDGSDGEAPPPRNKRILVSRRPRPSESRLFDRDGPKSHKGIQGARGKRSGSHEGGEIRLPSPAEGKLKWLPDGRVLERSILGTAEAFEEVDAQLGWASSFPGDGEDTVEMAGSVRSSCSQRSKRSLRSTRSGDRQSTEGHSVSIPTTKGSTPGTSSNNQNNLEHEMERYLHHIAGAEETAMRNRAASARKEAKLMEHVGLTEKLTMSREGNAMRQWARRQRDWHHVSQDMATKTGKAPEDLVMSTADEFRERSEEYQLIQRAIPAHEKYSSDGHWVMSLRGFGQRVCNVGNIFSGLFCVIEDSMLPPRAVRKPTGRPADATRKRTWRNSRALALRKRQLAPALRILRPRHLQADETGGLLVAGQDLLEWAATSSREYFQLRHVQELEVELAGMREVELQEEKNASGITGSAEGVDMGDLGIFQRRLSSLQAPLGPVLAVVSQKILLIESDAGDENPKRATVALRNAGSTVLFYSWSRVSRGETVVSANGDSGGDGVSARNGSESDCRGDSQAGVVRAVTGGRIVGDTRSKAAIARHAALQDPDGRFYCFQTTGTLLPGETAISSFSFMSTDPGIFSDRWRIETVPSASFIFSTPSTAYDPDPVSLSPNGDVGHEIPGTPTWGSFRGGDSSRTGVGRENMHIGDSATPNMSKNVTSRNNQDEEMGSNCGGDKKVVSGMSGSVSGGGVEVGLRGVAFAPDTREHVRRKLSEQIERGLLSAKIEELVREVVRDVRTPVREEEIRRRQREAFLVINADRGLYFTPQLYDSFMSLLQRAKAIALDAEAGGYDRNDDTVENSATIPFERQLFSETVEYGRWVGEGQEDGVPAITVDTLNTKECLREDGNGKDNSSASSCPASERSLGQVNGSDDDHREEHEIKAGKNLRKGDQGDGRAPDRGEGAVNDGNDAIERALSSVSPRTAEEEVEQATKELPSFGLVVEEDKGTTVKNERENEKEEIESLRVMLHRLDCSEWDGAVSTVLKVIDGLSKWIPPPDAVDESLLQDVVVQGSDGVETIEVNGGVGTVENNNDDEQGGNEDDNVKQDEDEDKDGEEEEEEEEEEEDDEEAVDTGEEDNEESGDEEEESDEGGHPLLLEQRVLRAQWRCLVMDAQLEPKTDYSIFMREEVGIMVEDIASAIEEVRREAGSSAGGPGTPRGAVLGYDEDSVKTWAAACPAGTFIDIENGPQTRAAAAAKAGNPLASFLAFVYGKITSKMASTANRFEGRVSNDENKLKNAAVSARRAVVLEGPDGLCRKCNSGGTPPHTLSRLAGLTVEDIEAQRLLLHVDFSRAPDGSENNLGESNGGQLSTEVVRLVAEQVREILSAKPGAVAIVSELGYPLLTSTTLSVESPPQLYTALLASEELPTPLPSSAEASGSSLRTTADAISSLLGMEVTFYDNVPEMAEALKECNGSDGGSPSFGPRLLMAERLSAPGVVPAPPVEEPELSDGEEERLPDFSWGGEEEEIAAELAKKTEAARLAIEGFGEGDLSAMLAGVVDVVVLDAPRTMYEPRREIPWGPMPTTGLTVAGTGLHGDLTAMAYLTEKPDRPLLAMIGGSSLEPRLKLIDGLLDLVDILGVGGGLAATFIAAAHASETGSGSGGRRANTWGKGTAGLPRDPSDVFEAAKRLLVKARKRGVEMIMPSDFVVGDVEVDEHGSLPGQVLPDDDDQVNHNGNANEIGDTGEPSASASGLGGDADASDGGDGGERVRDVAAIEVEADDPAIGFEYDGETMDVSLEDGIPKGFRTMDVGPQTAAALKDAVGRARAILWHGMLGVAECSAFQFGTREVLEAVTSVHDSDEAREAGTSPVVILCGRSLGEWAGLLVENEDDALPLGAGLGVSHICTDPGFCTRVLEGRLVPGLSQLSERNPLLGDADPGKVLRRRPFDEDEEEDDEGDEESNADSSNA